ncbi:MAG: hypothetical protein IK139_08135 [Lachnospiraceae bacterium]|nr:hypothetical protein [Lachnospiraceae bacterium]
MSPARSMAFFSPPAPTYVS